MRTAEPRVIASHSHGLRDQLAALARRKWWLIGCALLVPAAAVVLSMRQPAKYQASAEVLLSRQDLSSTLTNTGTNPALLDPDRIAQTQADLARVSTIAARVVKAVHVPGLTPARFSAESGVSIVVGADVLRLHVTDHDPSVARLLATQYALQYIAYRREIDTASLRRARQDVERHLSQLAAAGERRSAFYQNLAEKDQELRTMEALQTANASIVQRAGRATQVAPRPVRNGLLGVILGVLLGLGLAFLRETLDTRIRTSEELAERLGMPMLARIPEPSKKLQKTNRLVTVAEPESPQADAFRILRMNLAFANYDRGARTIMVTSAVQEEGKSTTIANLAVSLARAGHQVALVDLDLRRPFIDRFFGLEGRPGLTEVALGQVPLDKALTRLSLMPAKRFGHTNGSSANGDTSDVPAFVHVLPAGAPPPEPGEVVGWPSVASILKELASRMDFVLVDAPPILVVGDAVTLSERVDAVFLVARSTFVRRPMIAELRRQLESTPSLKLGFVLTQAEAAEGYGYAYGHRYGSRYRPSKAETPDEELLERERLTL